MSSTLAPFGLKPANLLGAQGDAGATRLIAIKQNDSNALFFGDPVVIVASGSGRGYAQRFNTTVTTTTVTSSCTPVGVFVGCRYTDPVTGRPEWKQYYPGSINASDIYAYVVDDPDALFECQADGSITQAMLGCNAAIIQTAANSTATGASGIALQASSVNSTNTLPLRIVDFSTVSGNAVADTYTRVVVRINTHFHRTATGTGNS